jgi:hypothetical protein
VRILLGCAGALRARARYVFDTLCLAAGRDVVYLEEPPGDGSWIAYTERLDDPPCGRVLRILHDPLAWADFDRWESCSVFIPRAGVAALFGRPSAESATRIGFDLVANAFFFLSGWAERRRDGATRRLYADSVYARKAMPQDTVDRYLQHLLDALQRIEEVPARRREGLWGSWRYAVVLSHDVDFLPVRPWDQPSQALRSAARHLLKHRSPSEAARGMAAYLQNSLRGRDSFGCVPEIIREECRRGVRSSFQVAVARRHPSDVNYSTTDPRVQRYLTAITDAGFDLCLHGSYRSTEQSTWYEDEVETLTRQFARPRGSRQHFLSFDPDVLFAAQERAGIAFDMSMGFPDRCGPRTGFSYPYFPYCLERDRPYDVVEIGLSIMDVTLRSYLGVRGEDAWNAIRAQLDDLSRKGGGGSVVWHPIVFGGARDPGYDGLYWRLVDHVAQTGGLATDGSEVDRIIRARAQRYPSFQAAMSRAA